jgi:hypothetical protein
MAALGISESSWPGTLENIFPKRTRLSALEDGAYSLGEAPFDDLLNAENFPKISGRLADELAQRMYVLAPTVASKDTFSQWLSAKAAEDAAILEPLRQTMLELFGLAQRVGND